MSANPWLSSPADVALHPVLEFVQKYRQAKGLAAATDPDHAPNATPKSSFITKLRQADAITAKRRNAAYQEYVNTKYPEIQQTARLVEGMDAIVQKFVHYFECFGDASALRESYFHVIRSNQVAWDDLSLENKGRLIQTLRRAVQAITTLNQSRAQTPEIVRQVQAFEDILEKTAFRDETQNFDDFYLEDLHAVLSECATILELFKANPQLKDPAEAPKTPDALSSPAVPDSEEEGEEEVESY